MSQSHLDSVLVVVVALAGLGVLAAFRTGARSGHRLARHTQEVTRMGGNLIRALGTAAVIVGVQWAVVSVTSDPRAWGVALGVPALFAGTAIARLFSVTEIIHTPTQRRGRQCTHSGERRSPSTRPPSGVVILGSHPGIDLLPGEQDRAVGTTGVDGAASAS